MDQGDPPIRRAATGPVPPATATATALRAMDSGLRSQVQQTILMVLA